MAYKSADLYLSYAEAIDKAEVEVTTWEAGFLNRLLRERPKHLSDKQRAVLDAMAEKYLQQVIE